MCALALSDPRTRFGALGVRLGRNNHDGSNPVALDNTGPRFLGFANTVDLSAVLTASVAALTIKVDGVSQTENVDFTAAASEEAVTVAEAFAALNTASFDNGGGITFSADTVTGRLMGKATSGKYVQVTGPLAAALDFGQSLSFGGSGLEFCKYLSSKIIDIGLPKNIKDSEEITLEAVDGSLTTMIIGALTKGIDPVLAIKEKDYKLIQLVQGGTSVDTVTEKSYEPPSDDESEHPSFWMEIYGGMFSDGIRHMGGYDQVEHLFIRNLIGLEGDIPVEVKAWAKYMFNLKGVSGVSSTGAKLKPWKEYRLTVAQWLALDLANV
jgi:hypothetical protein